MLSCKGGKVPSRLGVCLAPTSIHLCEVLGMTVTSWDCCNAALRLVRKWASPTPCARGATGSWGKCSLILNDSIRRSMEMKIKVHLVFLHIHPAGYLQDKMQHNQCWQECGVIGTLQGWWDCKGVQLLQKTVWQILRKLNIELPYDLAIPLPVYTQRNCRWCL